MTRLSVALSFAAVLTAAPAAAQPSRVVGQETVIPYTNGGAIRQYRVDRNDMRIVHMQDQRMRWYKVTLSGACLPPNNSATLVTRTRGDRLDRRALVGTSITPSRLCGIESIVNADPPTAKKG